MRLLFDPLGPLARYATAHQQTAPKHNSSPTAGLPSGLAVRQQSVQRSLANVYAEIGSMRVEAQMIAHDIFADLPRLDVLMRLRGFVGNPAHVS